VHGLEQLFQWPEFRDGGRARVWVRAEEAAGGMTQIAVADSGIGIAEARRAQAAERSSASRFP